MTVADVGALVAGTIAAAIARLGRLPDRPSDVRAIGVGWATVDTDRTERSFGLPFETAEPDVALGSSCRVATLEDGMVLILLEPATEGRLARSLARFDEGPTVVWFAAPAVIQGSGAAPTSGPFGPERLLADRTHEAPFLFAVASWAAVPAAADPRGPAG